MIEGGGVNGNPGRKQDGKVLTKALEREADFSRREKGNPYNIVQGEVTLEESARHLK